MIKLDHIEDKYTISGTKYLEHLILLDALESKEPNDKTVVRKQNNVDVGLELSNDEIADNQQLITEHLKDLAYNLGYASPFNVIQQLNPKFRLIAVLEMFYKLQIRAIHRVNGDNAFLILTTHDEIRICDIKNMSMGKAISALVDPITGSYIVNRVNYEKSIKAACILCRETNRASVGFIFHQHSPTLEELNEVIKYLNRRGKAEFLAFNNSIEVEVAEGYPIQTSNSVPPETSCPFSDDEEIPEGFDDTPEEPIIVCDENHEPIDTIPEEDVFRIPNENFSPFTPKFQKPVTSTPLDSEDELPF